MRSCADCRRAVAIALVVLAPFILSFWYFRPQFAQGTTDYGGYRPHYQGFGVKTKGGRGGAIYRVTRLEDDRNPGSLRVALDPDTCVPRIVIFEVSGTIHLSSRIEITCPFLTVAGQTAPSPGILIGDRQLRIDTHDVVLQHLRIRRGDLSSTLLESAIWVRNDAYNIVLDHVSLSWGTDESLTFNAPVPPEPREVSVLDSIISETLDNPIGGQTDHSRAVLFQPSVNGTATMMRTLMASNDMRNPQVRFGWRFALVNNVIYNYRGSVGGANQGGTTYTCASEDLTTLQWPFEVAHIGNVAIPGPDTPSGHKTIKLHSVDRCAATSKFYFEGNQGLGMTGPTGDGQWAGIQLTQTTQSNVRLNSRPSWYNAFGFVEMQTSNVEAFVLANAGARPLDRDTVDARIVAEVAARRGRIVDTLSQTPEGRIPELARRTRALTLPSSPHTVVDGVGRTRIEAWLEDMARALEPQTGPGGSGSGGPPAPTPPGNLRLIW